MERLLIDDPVSAFPVHGLCGIWGVLFTGLLAKEEVRRLGILWGRVKGREGW